MNNNILVTGASGHLGSRVLHHLLESRNIPADRLVAGSRDPSKLSDLADRGVEVRRVDFDDARSLPAAFAGIGTLLIVSTDALDQPGKRLRQHETAVAAAIEAGVDHIAYTSMPNPEPGNAVLFAGDHYGTEQTIKASGIPYTIFRNGWYQENLLMSLPQVTASGKWHSSAGAGRIAHVARDDVAAAIAGALAEANGESRTHTLTGPQAFSTDEIATLAASILGGSIEVVHVSDDDLLEGLKQAGVPEAFAALLVSFDANTRSGRIGDVTSSIEALSGRKPRALSRFLEENRAALLGK